MKVNVLINLDDKELQDKLIDLKEEFFNVRFQHKISQLNNTAKIKYMKKDIARVKTIIRERKEKI